MNLTIKEIAKVLGSSQTSEQKITNVEFDSRKISAGDLFVPLKGTRDGHEFATYAQESGAIATLWSEDIAKAPEGLFVFFVSDTKKAFQKLASYYRQKLAPKVLAITGSNGKTTTKDMTEAVLAQKYQTYKTQGNYNNELGLPYTILHMPETTEVLVLEMGMDHAGDLTLLSQIGQPDAAAITLIGEAHIESLGSREGIAKGKMEITAGLKKDGVLFIPVDEPLLSPLIRPLNQKVVTFGLKEGMVQAEVLNTTKQSTEFSINGKNFLIPVIGSYNVKNALVAYSFGHYFGLSNEEIAAGLKNFHLTKDRTQWSKAANGADILSDVYNANPTAMGLVLDSFAELTLPGRKIAVLADMLELGKDSKQMHRQMAKHIGDSLAEVYLYGSDMEALYQVLKDSNKDVFYFTEDRKKEMIEAIKRDIQAQDSVLLKGSNGMGLAEVIIALQEK
ncbi:MAG: UDP-N-acetylmuramoyl-tripeptide--D-alanyl-D-alanine ligase [Tetragenococcus halophilus]|nr:UDP-N-acetylmuramoyl-tripeptide--D-alanyl-D-alanine ligase [Tetragenococcus halophilus]MDN6143855.1 UDP-N-acetylmuramoyl-tripeptide--D-alanyl-D-alanine ligase [Tetragenococcus halophilus]MDN6153679.1 UDP-N-acetylmuramoyl-tripeptide--D-alanyl-D-alanine ligase [Tetragenococcus halophilus]MDN6257856.1 UDP-N-acetylmuramoyl-tripeptide--D-alanyl-D-alanine ligase [Tetragenococcus halophilus]MDN6265373.1 UDP-N-acetylmuramoyl-tripeptide--D-alanyl-D-alanine ligase [Tetragenococcus halophilus]